MYQGGYTGKILRINLTDQTFRTEDLPLELARDYIGGAGFCIKYLFDEVKKGTDPLGPENNCSSRRALFQGPPSPAPAGWPSPPDPP